MTSEPTPSVVLVVANETLTGSELVDAVRRRAERGPIRVLVVAPVTQPQQGYVVYRDSRRASAGRRLDRTLSALREAGIPAHGGVFDDDPLTAVKDVLASEEIDEIVVSTHPETKSGWLRKNLARGDPSRRRRPPRRAHRRRTVACARSPTSSSSRTRPCSASRCSTGSARARTRGTRASSSSARRATCRARSIPEAERRLRVALSTLRARGHRRPRPDRAPRSRSPRRCRRSTTSGSTRSSSRPSRASARAGSGAISSAASARRAASPSSTSSRSRAAGRR